MIIELINGLLVGGDIIIGNNMIFFIFICNLTVSSDGGMYNEL